jgi:hypothetical protein
VLGVWESWSVFSGGVLDALKRDFYEPPLTLAEMQAEAEAAETAKKEEAKKVEEAAGWKSKFKKVESASATPVPALQHRAGNGEAMGTGAESVPSQANVSHARFKPVAGLDGASDGSAPPVNTAPASSGGLSLKSGLKGCAVPKRRMRAEDMFGDSDDE